MIFQDLQKLMNQKKKLKNADIKQITLQVGNETLTVGITVTSVEIKKLILEDLKKQFYLQIAQIEDEFDKGENNG